MPAFDLKRENFNQTILTYHRVFEAFKYAFGMRAKLGDPDFGGEEIKMVKLFYFIFQLNIFENI